MRVTFRWYGTRPPETRPDGRWQPIPREAMRAVVDALEEDGENAAWEVLRDEFLDRYVGRENNTDDWRQNVDFTDLELELPRPR